MFKISKKVEYALISMLYMAERHDGQLTTAKELSQIFNIPQEIVGKVLQSLARSGLINSEQGVKGGYQLGRPPESIALSGVIRAVVGPIRVVGCIDDPESCSCDQLDYCNMRNPMETIQMKLTHFFNSISLRDLQINRIEIRPTGSVKGQQSVPVKLIEPTH